MLESVPKCRGMKSVTQPWKTHPVCTGTTDGVNQPCQHYQFAGDGLSPEPKRSADGRLICANHKPVDPPCSGDCAKT